MTRLFKNVKFSVTARQAAERYGLTVSTKGMACCPFHHDRAPSMKLDERYYCFGCGATGDAIDLTARLLNLSPKDAALRLAGDFGIRTDTESLRISHKRKNVGESENHYNRIFDILYRYRSLLDRWEKQYAPQGKNDEWHSLFCEALQNKDYVTYLLDELKNCKQDELEGFEKFFRNEVERIDKRFGETLPGGKKNTGSGTDVQGRSG